MTFYCNNVVKRVGKYYSLHSIVPRCASHWIIKLRYLSRNFFRNVTNFMVTLYRMWIRTSQNQKTNWIGGKGFNVLKTCQNLNSTDVAEELKPVYNTNCSLKNNLKTRIQSSVPKFFAIQKRKFSRRQKTYNRNAKVEKVYKRIPPYLTYIGDAIDQGATRLGGL